ncbi:rim15, signal transduction response regulator [Coemansia sp. BCRC 34301]|nr:rim15, signal transduction response regulator [Coemansia sp. BCRC 34301]
MELRTDEPLHAPEPDAATPDASRVCQTYSHPDILDNSQLSISEQHRTPMTRRMVAGGLGLRAPSVHTPENASTYSDRPAFDSLSSDVKPPSQKSSGMSLVRRLRRLSSAALHGKVNRLFSRSTNPSQDSLLINGPASPSPCPSPGVMPGSPTVCSRTDSSDSLHSRKPAPYATYERQTVGANMLTSSPAAEWRASNAHNLPPLPPKPPSTRRNRAMTEVTPLAIHRQPEGTESEAATPDASDNSSALQRIAQSRVKAANSPLVASPLSRRSFHTLHAAANFDESGRAPAASPPHMAKSASENQFSTLLTPSAQTPQRMSSPLILRTPSHDVAPAVPSTGAMADAHRSTVSQRQGYHHLGYFDDDMALRAADTPSPPDKSTSRTQAYYASDLGTPTIQRRRTALTTLDWANQSGAMMLQPPRLSRDALQPPPLPPPKPQQQHQQQQLRQPDFGMALAKSSSGSGADSPLSMLSAFQARPRVISGRLRQPSAGTSARSSTSIASESTHSWASAMSNADGSAGEGDDNEGDEQLGGHALSSFAPDQTGRRTDLNEVPSAGPQAQFDSSLLDWQMSQEEPATAYSCSPLSASLAHEPVRAMAIAPLSTDTFGGRDRRRVISTPSRSSATSLAVGAESPVHQPLSEADELDLPMAELSLSSHSASVSASASSVSVSQLIRPRGGSQPIHLARAATTNAIRLKEKSAGQSSYGASSSAQYTPVMRTGPGSAPESFNIDLAIEKNKVRLRVRATSTSNQSFVPGDNTPFSLDGLSPSYSSSSNASHSQQNTLSRGNAATGMPTSRPTSSMSVYTMSPMSSTPGDDHQSTLMAQLWQPSAMFRSSPERASDSHVANAGLYTPSSTSSPPTHYHISGAQAQQHGNQSTRLSSSSVQRSASGHSVSSGISELLEPSSVSQARKDALWQVLVVSKSRADSEIDKIMRQWKESDNGTVVCTLDPDAKPGVGDDDAMILMVKRGHRRSTSDIKRADGDKNEFRRRVVDLTSVIRSSTVAELSNERFTRGITEQLYGLLTEQRTRFPADANVGALILDVLYQFSAVSQTVSQLSVPSNAFPSGVRGGASGEASPAISQFPSPLLAPDASLGRGMLGHIQPLSSALSAHYEIANARNASRGHQLATSSVSVPTELGDYRIGRTASESLNHTIPHLQRHQQGSSSDPYLLGNSGTRGARPLDGGAMHVSSPRLAPGTAHSSTASLISLLAPVHAGSFYSASGSIGRSAVLGGSVLGQMQPVAGLQQRQRSYFPQPPGTPHSSRLSVDTPESEAEVPARQSMDDAAIRPTLRRHISKLSVSSEAADTHSRSYRSAARASLPPQHFYQYSARLSQQVPPLHLVPPSTPQVPALQVGLERDDHNAAPTTPKRVARPASMCISGVGGGYASLRHFSESFSRQEKLANLLGQDSDFSDSVPTSPAEPPARPLMDMDTRKRDISTLPLHADSLRTIPETRRGSEVDVCSLERQLARLSNSSATVDTQALPQVGEDPVGTPGDAAAVNAALSSADAAVAVAREADSAPADLEPNSAVTATAEDELVICRMCERHFCRSELDAHSDVCVLEQTRAMQLDVVNQRIRRLRDSISKRLSDITKVRQWDRVAIRESERIIRIANRSIAWPEGDSQHEQMVAKAKFTKYIDKLETITGRSAPNTALTAADGVISSPAAAATSTGSLPRADIETIWLAVHLLARVREKFTIIEEFDQEFSRLEQQEALVREAESLDYDIGSEPGSQFHDLATWSQLAHAGRSSSVASGRNSMDYIPSQSESGSATPDTHASHAGALGKNATALTRRHSRRSRPDRRSLSRSARPGAELVDADSQSNGSGSRNRVSLFAALFRNSSIANMFARGKDSAASSSVLKRRNTPSSFASSSLQSIGKPSSVLRRLSQNASPAPSVRPSPAATSLSSGCSTPAGDQTTSAGSAPPVSPADVPLSSPVTRQRNNSQLSSLRATPESAAKVPRMPSTDDFDFVKPISRGAFGRVYLTRKKATKDLYAIKVMRKKDIIVKNMVTQTLAERRALSLLSNEWVVRLYYAFHSSKHLFLVMEYLVGGDLAGLLRVWVVMEAEAAKFYIAEIGCAIDYLHRNSIVHRDIKPDNVMLASDGHIKLTDFGLSQVAVRGNDDARPLLDGSDPTHAGDFDDVDKMPDRADEYWRAPLVQPGSNAPTASLAANNALATKALPQSKRAHARKSSRRCLGTPDYLAPELQVGASNGFPVDWWALGVCLFEFLCGYPPFTDESPEAIFRNILNHAIDWPEEEGYVSEAAMELINALLRPDPATRAYWKDIKAARLYEGWDLDCIRQMEPPLVPQPDDEVDTSYFESCQRTEIQRLSNATFLQMNAARRPPPPPVKRSASKPESSVLPEPEDDSQQDTRSDSQQGSQQGSHRGSRREGAASRAASAANGSSDMSAPGAGQLKRLFSDVPGDEDDYVNVGYVPSFEDCAVLDDMVASRVAESIATVSSSDKYSFTNDGIGESAERDEPTLDKSQSTDGPGSLGEMDQEGEQDSISSLSKLETEPAPLPGLQTPTAPRMASQYEVPLTPGPLLAVTALPLLPIGHAKRAMSRSPSQFSSGILDSTGHSGPSSKSHSRCASATIVLAAAKKGGANVKTRRPSHSPEYSSESEHMAPLIRSSSTDERLQCAASGSASALIPSADDCGSAASSNAGGDDDNDGNGSETRDEDAERAFEDFTYKNIALLSHVNRGVSSSGHATPAIERPPPGMSALSTAPAAPMAVPSHRPSVYGSAPGSARGSPINAYDIKSQPADA